MHTVVDALCTGIPANRQFHYDVIGAGHYGIFSGRRWREKVYPRIRDFIASHQPKEATTARKPATRRLLGTSDNASATPAKRSAPARRKRQAA